MAAALTINCTHIILLNKLFTISANLQLLKQMLFNYFLLIGDHRERE